MGLVSDQTLIQEREHGNVLGWMVRRVKPISLACLKVGVVCRTQLLEIGLAQYLMIGGERQYYLYVLSGILLAQTYRSLLDVSS